MTLDEFIYDIAQGLAVLDASRVQHKNFQPGIGPFGEPQLVKLLVQHLKAEFPERWRGAETRRTPDLIVPNHWSVEVKLARPFGDNGRPAEHWSENLLHPYPGNTSCLGDCYKLTKSLDPERKAVVIIGYEHHSPEIDLEAAIRAFELIAEAVCGFQLSQRVEQVRSGLIHPVHQRVRVVGYEIL